MKEKTKRSSRKKSMWVELKKILVRCSGHGGVFSFVLFSLDLHRRLQQGLQTLFAGVAYLDALAPFRVQDLVGTDTPGRVGVENAVDDIAAAGLVKN